MHNNEDNIYPSTWDVATASSTFFKIKSVVCSSLVSREMFLGYNKW